VAVFDRIGEDDYEQVVFCHDRPSGLRAIIAVHSTRLGPALGGTRFYPYPNEDEALVDVLRLARAMTYKAAAAGLDLGGGKAVIIGDPTAVKSEALLRAYGRHVDGLAGRYLTAEDVGTTQADMDLIRRETECVTGVSESLGGSGDPSEATAYGVLWAMKAVARHLWADTSLDGRQVVVSGVGKVGGHLVAHLVAEGARVSVDLAGVELGVVVEAHRVLRAAQAPARPICPGRLVAVLAERPADAAAHPPPSAPLERPVPCDHRDRCRAARGCPRPHRPRHLPRLGRRPGGAGRPQRRRQDHPDEGARG